MPTVEERFWSKVKKTDGCWLWTAWVNVWGYGGFYVGGADVGAHRFSYELHKGKIPKGLLVRHKCHNPSCVNPEHLVVGTQADNMNDCVKAGRQCKGETRPKAKLTEKQVVEIKSRVSMGAGTKELSEIYGVSKSTISNIKYGRRWKHI